MIRSSIPLSMRLPMRAIAVAGAAALAACEGQLEIRLTDAALDTATEVNVRITGLELIGSGGTQTVDFDARTIDLTELTEGRTTILISSDDVSEGTYTGVRLLIDSDNTQDSASTIRFDDGRTFPLNQASGSSAEATGTFTVEEDETTAITLDFDARASVRSPAAGSTNAPYQLTPVLRLVQDDNAGRITGTVDQSLLTDPACDNGTANDVGNVVYVFEGSGVTPDDLDGVAPEPITSAVVAADTSTGVSDYVAAFLPAGDYTVALTCQGRIDEPGVDDAVAFVQPTDVTVSANAASEIDFD